ncbi:hypothetical protein [Priestia megaterium]|nr:hypothetical protein [Priestia megaterium]
MEKKRRTFDIGFEKKVVDLYLEGRLVWKANEMSIGNSEGFMDIEGYKYG